MDNKTVLLTPPIGVPVPVGDRFDLLRVLKVGYPDYEWTVDHSSEEYDGDDETTVRFAVVARVRTGASTFWNNRPKYRQVSTWTGLTWDEAVRWALAEFGEPVGEKYGTMSLASAYDMIYRLQDQVRALQQALWGPSGTPPPDFDRQMAEVMAELRLRIPYEGERE
jgi:hypothetical protein